MNAIEIDLLRERIDYDPETGVLRWKESLGIKTVAGKECGGLHSSGYRNIVINKRPFRAHRIAFALFYGKWPIDQIDHINGIKDDNRISNLREASREENAANRAKSKNNTSGFKGVYWGNWANKWVAQIFFKKKRIYLGLFDCPQKAHNAYVVAANKLHGDFSNKGNY